MQSSPDQDTRIRVMALNALAYCERHLEEVEEIRLADHRVYAGHALYENSGDPNAELQSLALDYEDWGPRGKIGYVDSHDMDLMLGFDGVWAAIAIPGLSAQ